MPKFSQKLPESIKMTFLEVEAQKTHTIGGLGCTALFPKSAVM